MKNSLLWPIRTRITGQRPLQCTGIMPHYVFSNLHLNGISVKLKRKLILYQNIAVPAIKEVDVNYLLASLNAVLGIDSIEVLAKKAYVRLPSRQRTPFWKFSG